LSIEVVTPAALVALDVEHIELADEVAIDGLHKA